MKCPDCAREIKDGLKKCPHCGANLGKKPKLKTWLRVPLVALGWIIAAAILSFGIYKLYFLIDAYRVEKLYARGAFTPTISEITMADGNRGHAITYYGRDGDRVFFEDIDAMIPISGGVARLEVADNIWFGANVNDMDYAEVSLQAILVYESGDKRRLPAYNFTIPAPESPITIIAPVNDGMSVNTSVFKLQAQVVPGSAVSIDGRDVTDIVSRAGLLEVSLNIYPIGDNVITIVVNTPGSREARKDVTIYRQQQEIALEVNPTTPSKSTSNVVTISGKCEPGARVSVETPIIEGSLTQDFQTGAFSFIAQLSVIGDNRVRFRASMDGKADSVISLDVHYLPTYYKYVNMAWAMDYVNLRRMYTEWQGRVFKCVGKLVDVTVLEGQDCVVLDVSKGDEPELVVLVNHSTITSFKNSGKYVAYADVMGRIVYNGHYYPLLAARYMLEDN